MVASRLAFRRGLAAIDRDYVHAVQTGLGTEAENRSGHVRERILVALHEPRRRGASGLGLRRGHAVGDIFDARALDRPR
jgi:hypothetical protein